MSGSMPEKKQGFSLIEFTVVLIIIALVAGGIAIGKDIVRNAELQSIISDTESYKQAIKLFREKYKSYPGDMPNAEATWGSNGDCAAPVNSDSPTSLTCNGNGDGYIGQGNGLPSASGSSRESVLMWQHLSNAELVQEKFSGVYSDRNDGVYPGINIPKTPLRNTGMMLYYAGYSVSLPKHFDAEYNHIFTVGSPTGIGSDSLTTEAGISGTDALRMDTKADDGKPGTGKILTLKPIQLPNCASSSVSSTAEYLIDQGTVPVCSLIFITGF